MQMLPYAFWLCVKARVVADQEDRGQPLRLPHRFLPDHAPAHRPPPGPHPQHSPEPHQTIVS